MYLPSWRDHAIYHHKYVVLPRPLVPYCRWDATVTNNPFSLKFIHPWPLNQCNQLGTATSGTARSSSHQLNVLYFLLNRDFAKRPVISSRPSPFPVVMADHAIIPSNHNVCISIHNINICYKIIRIYIQVTYRHRFCDTIRACKARLFPCKTCDILFVPLSAWCSWTVCSYYMRP